MIAQRREAKGRSPRVAAMPACGAVQPSKKANLMDIQVLLVILCVAAALFFIVRRFWRALRRGHCACDCQGGVNSKSCCAGDCSGRKPQ